MMLSISVLINTVIFIKSYSHPCFRSPRCTSPRVMARVKVRKRWTSQEARVEALASSDVAKAKWRDLEGMRPWWSCPWPRGLWPRPCPRGPFSWPCSWPRNCVLDYNTASFHLLQTFQPDLPFEGFFDFDTIDPASTFTQPHLPLTHSSVLASTTPTLFSLVHLTMSGNTSQNSLIFLYRYL